LTKFFLSVKKLNQQQGVVMNKKIFTMAFFMTAIIAVPLAADNDKDDIQSESADNSSEDTADNASSKDSEPCDRDILEGQIMSSIDLGH
jgi:hypothetical protein